MADRVSALTLRQLVLVAVAVILGFALVFPFTGVVDTVGGTEITQTISNPTDTPAGYLLTVFSKSLQLSVLTFTLVGAEGLVPIGATRWLVALESLLGMGFFALLVATLVEKR